MNHPITRRTMLRGAGVALSLPWLASLSPREVRAADVARPRRFLPIFFPCGAAEWWTPSGSGQGDSAWSLSPILEPLQAFKSKMIVLTNLENYSPFGSEVRVDASHGNAGGAWLASANSIGLRKSLKSQVANGISVDQVIAQAPAYSQLKLASMQVGLSSWESFCDSAYTCPNSRSISWRSTQDPAYKDVDPGTVFDNIVNAVGPNRGMPDVEAQKRRVLGKSVLDAVLATGAKTRARLGSEDQKTYDQFLDSVRTVERNVTDLSTGNNRSCTIGARPTLKAQPQGIKQDIKDPTSPFYPYSKEAHADVMNDLIVMAFQCDVTRVISYMLEDERSEYSYSLPVRNFYPDGPPSGQSANCGEYHAAQHDLNHNKLATINWWQSKKVAQLAEKLANIPDDTESSVLDNTVILYGSGMHGSNHQYNELPLALIGGGGGTLLTNQHLVFSDALGSERPLRDLHFTLLKKTFGVDVDSFGEHSRGVANTVIDQILKT